MGLLSSFEGRVAAGVHSISGDCPHPHFFPNQSILTPPSVLSRYLQQLVTAQDARNRELEQELNAYPRRSRSELSMEPPSPTQQVRREGGDGNDLMMGLEEEERMRMGMGMKGPRNILVFRLEG